MPKKDSPAKVQRSAELAPEIFTGKVAYHKGPPELEYFGRHWVRGIEQPMTKADFDTLLGRPDAVHFNFVFTGVDVVDSAPSNTTEE